LKRISAKIVDGSCNLHNATKPSTPNDRLFVTIPGVVSYVQEGVYHQSIAWHFSK